LEYSNISSPNLHSVIGYGTFITKGLWKDKQNVAVCLVKNYIRILPEGSWFPYALPFNGGSFYALKFNVKSEELENLDYYEGLHYRFFERVKIKVYLKTKEEIEAFIYIPTKETIKTQNLSPELDINDKWKEKIKTIPQISEKFPELLL